MTEEVFPAKRQKRKVSVRKRTVKKDEPELTDDEMRWQSYFHEHNTEDPEPMVLIIWGSGGSGKTELALKLAAENGSVYMIETEGGHNLHTANRVMSQYEGELELFKCVVDVLDPESKFTQKWFSGGGRAWEVFEEIANSLQHAPPGTVIIDSGSDMLPMLVSQFSIDWNRGDMAFPPMLYKQCYGKLRLLVNGLRKNHHVIITAQEESKYDRRSDTPKVIGSKMSLWNKADYMAEHTIKIENNDGDRVFIVKERKNNFLKLDEVTWDELVNGFSDSTIEASERRKAIEKYNKGISALGSIDINVDGEMPESTEEILAKVTQMREQYKSRQAEIKAEADKKRESKRIRKTKPE